MTTITLHTVSIAREKIYFPKLSLLLHKMHNYDLCSFKLCFSIFLSHVLGHIWN